MALSTNLQLRQKQGLTLTPQLLQSIKLLQMNAIELSKYIQDEVDKNPILEIARSGDDLPAERRTQDNSLSHVEKSGDGIIQENNSHEEPSEHSNMGTVSADPVVSTTSGIDSGSFGTIENWVAAKTTMNEALLSQAAMTFRDANQGNIAHEIINSLDEDGYLRRKTIEIAKAHNIEEALVLDVLSKVQLFDPPGIAARNLSECMQIQLKEKYRLDPAMIALTNHLELLAQRNFENLAIICEVSSEDLMDMVREIQELEPRPGNIFDTAPIMHVASDVLISPRHDGGWHLELNTQNLPKVLVNREYYAEIKNIELGANDRKFMVDNLQNANWLVASLDQRAQTILKVATEIVRQQDAFFTSGPEFLKPLVLRTVAEEIKMHESTISRVVANKYLSCAAGVYPFKYFFMSGIMKKDGEGGVGSEAIKLKIKSLINNETRDNVLSDAQISVELESDGIEIARRTVMKYRESMQLSSSVQRKRIFNQLTK